MRGGKTKEYTRGYDAININHERSSRICYRYLPVARTHGTEQKVFALWVNDYVCRMNKSRVPGNVATTFTHTAHLSHTRRRKKRWEPLLSSFRALAYTQGRKTVDDPGLKKMFQESFWFRNVLWRIYPPFRPACPSPRLLLRGKLRAVAGCRKIRWLLISCIDHTCPGLSDSITHTFAAVWIANMYIYVFDPLSYIYLL